MRVPTETRPSSDVTDADVVSRMTADRILTVASLILDGTQVPLPQDGLAAADRLGQLVQRLIRRPDPALAWLLLTALAGAFPLGPDVRALLRAARLDSEREVTLQLMDRALALALAHGSADRPMRVVSGVVVDMDACARSDFHNGIQRVARETVMAWLRRHELTAVAWTTTAGMTRELTPGEEMRATRWGSRVEAESQEIEPTIVPQGSRPGPEQDEADRTALVVPWQATIVLAEVPLEDRCAPLAALAEYSGNTVVAIGYDAIPVVSADLRPLGEANAFAAYLSVVKQARRVAAISTSAMAEFSGFAYALTSQGLSGPRVSEILLPSDVPDAPAGYVRTPPPRPRVLSVGRLEPHKNHGSLLHAAELLWREGHDFDLELIGADGWSTEAVDRQLAQLERAGRPLTRRGSVSDDDLWLALREASFTVFVSLHEGYGLPVAESLACGTPVITTRYGSQAEIASPGGCLTVDPRDDQDLVVAMRRLLTEPDTLARLRDEALARPERTWQMYADELWSSLVENEEP